MAMPEAADKRLRGLRPGGGHRNLCRRPVFAPLHRRPVATYNVRLEEAIGANRVDRHDDPPNAEDRDKAESSMALPSDSDAAFADEARLVGQAARRREADAGVEGDLHTMARLRDLGTLCAREGEDVPRCLGAIVEAAIAIMQADKGNIHLLDRKSGGPVIAAQQGFGPAFLSFFEGLRAEDSSCGAAMRSGSRVVVEDVRESDIFRGQPSLQIVLDAGVQAVASTPLVSSSGTLLGMISTHWARPHRPSARELGFLDLLVRQSADYLERRQSEAALAQHAAEQAALHEFTNRLYRAESLKVAYVAALDAIAAALQCDRASILRLDDRQVMRFVAWRGLSAAYRKAVEGHSPWRPNETNPQPIYIEDMAGAELSGAVRRAVETAGIRALAFIPLVANGRLAGKFMTYYPAPHAFAAEELGLALNVARQLGFAIERMETEGARRSAEQELRRLKEKLEAEIEERTLERDRIWNVSEDLLGVSNFDGYFINMNPAWTKLLGWSQDEIKKMHVSELRHPDDAPHATAGRAQLAQGVPTVRMENRFRHKDGSWRWIYWTMTAENGLIYVSGRHVTAEKEAALALERAQRQSAHLQKMEALGQLTGGVAHDFNNLLMIVSGHAQILRERIADAKARRALDAILSASTRGESLTRQLLSFSRSQPLTPAVTDAAAAVNALRDVLAGLLQVNVKLSVDAPPSTWPVRVDKSELELALVNLAVNARDAMPEGGSLSITAANVSLGPEDTPEGLAGEFVALGVRDDGCGIPEEILGRVFEPFFTTKGADKGTGLGLAQVYGFARRSGGTVVLKSRPGQGTGVTIYLPRSRAPIEETASEEGVPPPPPGEARILVVEDNGEVQAVAVSLLEQLGYRTVAVDTAASAFQLLECGDPFTLVFTDVVLPGDTDGLMLARAVKSRFPEVPVVLTTGYAKVFDESLEFPVLRKPYQIGTLQRVMREALTRTTGSGAAATG